MEIFWRKTDSGTSKTLRGPDGLEPAYCSEELKWNEFSEKFDGDALDVGVKIYYENVYNHILNGEELYIKPEEVLQQIRVAELVHAQNPMPVIY